MKWFMVDVVFWILYACLIYRMNRASSVKMEWLIKARDVPYEVRGQYLAEWKHISYAKMCYFIWRPLESFIPDSMKKCIKLGEVVRRQS